MRDLTSQSSYRSTLDMGTTLNLAPTPMPPHITGAGSDFGLGLFPERRKTFAHRTAASRGRREDLQSAVSSVFVSSLPTVAIVEDEDEAKRALGVGDPAALLSMIATLPRKPLPPDLSLFRGTLTADESRKVKVKTAKRARVIVQRVLGEAERKLHALDEEGVFPHETNRNRCATWARQCLRQRLKLERVEAAYLRELMSFQAKAREVLATADAAVKSELGEALDFSLFRDGGAPSVPSTPIAAAAAAADGGDGTAAAAAVGETAPAEPEQAAAAEAEAQIEVVAAAAAAAADTAALKTVQSPSILPTSPRPTSSTSELEVEIEIGGFAGLTLSSARTSGSRGRSRGSRPQTVAERTESMRLSVARDVRASKKRATVREKRERTRALAATIDPHIRARVLGRVGSTQTIEMRTALPYFPDDVAAAAEEAEAAAEAAAAAAADGASTYDAPSTSMSRLRTAASRVGRERVGGKSRRSTRGGMTTAGTVRINVEASEFLELDSAPQGVVLPAWRVGRERAHHRMNENPDELNSLHHMITLAWKMLEVSTAEKMDFLVQAASSARRTQKVADIVPLLVDAARAMSVRERILALLRSHNDLDVVTLIHLESVFAEFIHSELEPGTVVGRMAAWTDPKTGECVLRVKEAKAISPSAQDAARKAKLARKVAAEKAAAERAALASAEGGRERPATVSVANKPMTVYKYLKEVGVRVGTGHKSDFDGHGTAHAVTSFVRVLRVLIKVESVLGAICLRLKKAHNYVVRFRGVPILNLLSVTSDQWKVIGNSTHIDPEDVTLPPIVMHTKNGTLVKRDVEWRRAAREKAAALVAAAEAKDKAIVAKKEAAK